MQFIACIFTSPDMYQKTIIAMTCMLHLPPYLQNIPQTHQSKHDQYLLCSVPRFPYFASAKSCKALISLPLRPTTLCIHNPNLTLLSYQALSGALQVCDVYEWSICSGDTTNATPPQQPNRIVFKKGVT